jgi:hypothetical protein
VTVHGYRRRICFIEGGAGGDRIAGRLAETSRHSYGGDDHLDGGDGDDHPRATVACRMAMT